MFKVKVKVKVKVLPLPLREGVGGRGPRRFPDPRFTDPLPPSPSHKGRGRSTA
jgi:hypothetical protein